MSNHHSDFEELRPTGEASLIPNEKLNEGHEADLKRQRVATTTGGYPDEPSDAGAKCQSCGASIPTGQTKCRFCLTNHLDNEAVSTGGTTDATLLQQREICQRPPLFYLTFVIRSLTCLL